MLKKNNMRDHFPLLNHVYFSGLPETGGICISPRPSDPDAEIVPGMAMRPFFGIKPALMDSEVACPSHRGGSLHSHTHTHTKTNTHQQGPRDEAVNRHQLDHF